MRIDPDDLREIQLLKYYRLIRKWACKTNSLSDADLELLIFLDCIGRFTRNDFINGTYIYSWDKERWERLRRDGWIEVWRHRNRTTIKYSIYQVSFKTKLLITRMYKIMLGKEDIPLTESSIFYKNDTYRNKVYSKAIDIMVKDKDR
jgi:hypothetical protein